MQPPADSLQVKTTLQALRLYYFCSLGALGAYLPLFPRWLDARGVQGVAMGAIAATLPAMSVISPPVFGYLADALGERVRLLRGACAGAFIAFALVALAARLDIALGFGGLFVAVLLFAFFRAPMVQLADVVALELSATGGTTYGQLRLWGSLGFALMAVAAGAWIDPTVPAPLPMIVAGGLFVAFAISFALPSRSRTPPSLSGRGSAAGQSAGAVRARALALLASSDFRVFLAASFLAQGAHSAYDLCFTLHLRDIGFPSRLVGVAWAIGVLAEIALLAFSGRLFARARPPVLLAVAFAGAAVRWALLAWLRSPLFVLVAQPLHAISFATMWVASLAYIKDRAASEVLATAQGLFSASTGTGSVIGMLVWGQLYRHGGGALTFGVASGAAVLACVLAVTFARSTRRGRMVEHAFFSAGSPDQE